MEVTQNTNCKNVYIFNKIKENSKDIQLLHKTFESLECNVIEIKNNTYSFLKEVVKSMVQADFSRFFYVVIIILDNTNDDAFIWTTTDNKEFHIDGDLITAMYANESLHEKLIFSIVQNNRTFDEKKTRKRHVANEDKIRIRQAVYIEENGETFRYSCKTATYFATSTGCQLKKLGDHLEPSPFIRILCEEIMENAMKERPIELTDVLNRISERVANETNEFPSKETNFLDNFVLQDAKY